MQKYIGRFRVKTPMINNNTFTHNKDDTYVRCKNNIEMYRYNNKILALYIPKVTSARKLKEQLWNYLTRNTQKIIKDDLDKHKKLTGDEWVFYFYEKYIDQVAKIVQPKTGGAKIFPRSKKNLQKKKYKQAYTFKNKKLVEIFRNKLKEIVKNNNGNISLYNKAYYFIEKQLDMYLLKCAKINSLKFIEVLDELELLKEAIDLLYDFENELYK